MALELYDDTLWRPIAADAPQEHLASALKPLKKINSSLAAACLDPGTLNGLLSWTRFRHPWQITAFVLRFGLGQDEAAWPIRIPEIAEQLQHPEQVIRNALGSTADFSVAKQLKEAHALLRYAPFEAKELNQLRALGISVDAWHLLAKHGEIFTIKQLNDHGAQNLTNIRLINPTKAEVIIEAMRHHGYWL